MLLNRIRKANTLMNRPPEWSRDYGGFTILFFMIESTLVFAGGILAFMGSSLSLILLVSTLGPAGLTNLEPAAWLSCVSLVGIGILCWASKLMDRPITDEHYEWLLSNYQDMGMPAPERVMTRHDLFQYCDTVNGLLEAAVNRDKAKYNVPQRG